MADALFRGEKRISKAVLLGKMKHFSCSVMNYVTLPGQISLLATSGSFVHFKCTSWKDVLSGLHARGRNVLVLSGLLPGKHRAGLGGGTPSPRKG